MSGQENGPVAAAVSTELQNSGCQFTFTHFQNEGWFEEWGRKLHRAVGVIVIFSEIYRRRFTPSLQKEAAAILERREKDPDFKLFVYDPLWRNPEDGTVVGQHQAPVISANIRDGAHQMGDFKTWERFARFVAANPGPPGDDSGHYDRFQAAEAAEAAATGTTTVAAAAAAAAVRASRCAH